MQLRGHELNHRILIVDDNPAIHADFRKILAPDDATPGRIDDLETILFDATKRQASTFELTHAHQGQEALKLVEAAVKVDEPFALAFVDVRMPPGWDGIETIERLWKVDPQLQVVICTAHSDYDWERTTARLGALDKLLILKKPFDHIEALQLARGMCTKWGLARQAGLRFDELERMVADRTAALEAAQEQARQAYKMEAVGRLAAGIAHDFNNALTVIQGYSSRQLGRAKEAESVEAFERIAAAATRAATLTHQLLAFSRKQVILPLSIEINRQLQSASPMLEPLLGPNIQLSYQLAPNLPPLLADPSQIDQIVLHLALNARDATPGGGRIVVETATAEATPEMLQANSHAKPGPHLRLTVRDFGIGMDAATVRNLFEPFFTTKAVGEGTGMGLATVHGIVEQHGGWIDVETVPGKGSAFHVYLPFAPESSAIVAPAAELPALRGAGTVIIAEDEEVVCELAATIFSECGFKSITAPDGQRALDLWHKHRHEVVLLFTDMVMPGGMSGRDLAERVRAEDPNLPVIYTSGYSADLLKGGMGLREGVNYLPKPYRPDQLEALVSAVLVPASAA